MQQDSVDIISKQLISFYAPRFLYYFYTILPSTFYSQTKLATEVYNDPLASNFYPEAMQL